MNDDLERCYMEFISYLKSNYPILCDGSGDAPRPKHEENTVLTVESSVPGQVGMYGQNPNGAWWCTMLWWRNCDVIWSLGILSLLHITSHVTNQSFYFIYLLPSGDHLINNFAENCSLRVIIMNHTSHESVKSTQKVNWASIGNCTLLEEICFIL